MTPAIEKRALAKELQAKINAIQGLGKLSGEPAIAQLSPFNSAFPSGSFPIGVIHEFVSYEPAHAASTNGFITAIAAKIIKEGGLCLWVGSKKDIFPLGVKHFGLEPDRIVFIHTQKHKDKLWIIEEALKCDALSIVISEMTALSFTESRRFQLAVERSGVTGFIHRFAPVVENAVACTTRWKIIPIPSHAIDGLPGIGSIAWDVQLLKVKNGRPNSWQVSWMNQRFIPISKQNISIPLYERHTG